MDFKSPFPVFAHGLGRMLLIVLIVAFILAFFVGRASADPLPGLTHSNATNYVGPIDTYYGARAWVRPKPETPVLSCLASTPVAQCVWGNAAFTYRKFGDLPADALVNVCTASIEPGPFAPPNRPSVDPACGDPCGCGNALDRKALIAKSAVVVETVEDLSKFTASSLGGVAPVATTLTWDVLGVDTCVASGSWTGAKAAKGSQNITGLTASARYVLTCTKGATTGSAAISWESPTTNVDATPLTNLAGTRIVYGTSADALTGIIDVPGAGVKAYTVTGLTPATWYFAARAYNSVGGESANSAVASKSIAGTAGKTWTKTIDVSVTAPPTVPNPPTGLVVTETTAYRLDQQPNLPVLVAVGTVPLRTRCTTERILDKYRVDNTTVKLASGRSRPNVALATCSVT